MKKETKNKLKTAGKIVLGVAAVGATGVALYVGLNKPAQVTTPSYRTYFRADGKPKVAFNTARRANWQAVKQLFLHGEVCNPYQAPNGKFYTGHSSSAIVRNINPFK